jgi:hypothetical protein
MDRDITIKLTELDDPEATAVYSDVMDGLVEAIDEHYDDVFATRGYTPAPRRRAYVDESGEEITEELPPTYALHIRVRQLTPPTYPLDQTEWIHILIHDINTSLQGVDANADLMTPEKSLQHTSFAEYLRQLFADGNDEGPVRGLQGFV